MFVFFDRYGSFKRICAAFAILAVIAAMSLTASVSAASQLQPGAVGHLVEVGPLDPATNFPVWYKDEHGKRMQLCLNGNDALCGYLPGDIPNDALPISFPDNFPEEAFYQLAANIIDSAGGVRAVTHLALEAAFLQGPPAPGDQMTFGRVRFFYGGLPAAGVYRITHPYGQDILTAVEDGKGAFEIRFTDDVGNLGGLKNGGPGDYRIALTSRIGPFLEWDTEKPPGYLGDPALDHTITGSAYVDDYGQPQNYVRIEGPFKSANGPFTASELVKDAQGNAYSINDPQYPCTNGVAASCLENRLFGVQGKEAVNGGVQIDHATYSRAPDGTVSLEVFANSEPSQVLIVRDMNNGSVFASTPMRGDKKNYYARVKVASKNTVPQQVKVENISDTPVSSFTSPLVDRVTATAQYDADTHLLTVTATSSDQGKTAKFTVAGYGSITGSAQNPGSGELKATYGAVPAVITVSSASGGSVTVPVTATGADFAPIPIVADAGIDQRIVVGNEAVLDGSYSRGDITSYSWTQTAGTAVSLLNANTAAASFKAPDTTGLLSFQLTVKGPAGTHSDLVNVNVVASINLVVANAGPDQTAVGGNAVTLDGSLSKGDITGYSWTQTGGPAVNLANANTAAPTFTAPPLPVNTPITFELSVKGPGGPATDTVVVTVTPPPPPVAKAVIHQQSVAKTEGTIDGSTSTGFIDTYAWTQTGGPPVTLATPNAAVTTFVAPPVSTPTTLTFVLTVRGPGGPSTATLQVEVIPPPPPVANAGPDQTAAPAQQVSLDGSKSTGDIDTYTWVQTGGPAVVITNGKKATPSFTAPNVSVPTALTFDLTVSGLGGSATDAVNVQVIPAPAAHAGTNQTVAAGSPVTLDGSGSTGTIQSYKWSQTGGIPAVTLTGSDTASPTFTAPDAAATLTFELTVTGPGGTNSSTVTIKVVPNAPTAQAGAAQTVVSGSPATLDGSGSTGVIDTYAWQQTGGTPVTLTGADTAKPTFTAPDTAGTLTFELTVTGAGGTSTSSVTVEVTPPVPVAHAGAAQTVAIGTAVTLDGSESTGTIDTYAWKQTGGTPVTLTGEDTASPTFTAPDTAGKLTFELTVTGPGGTASSTVTVTVTPDAPTADAGSAQTVASDAAVTLDGSGSTGTIDSYSWKQTAGPAVTLTGADSASASFKAPIVSEPTTLTFELTVTGPGGTASSSVNVEVTPPGAPTADAGSAQTVASDSAVTLDGTGSTGTIASYSWKQTAGPAVTLTGADAASASFKAPVVSEPTTLTFELTVTGPGGTTTSSVNVEIAPPGAPVANAGNAQTVVTGAPVTLDGSGSTGFIDTHAWTQTGGTPVTLSGADTVKPTFTAPDTAGTLTFELTVTGAGGTTSSTVTVEVTPPVPVAHAGAAQTAAIGAAVTLDGSGSTGIIGTYAWKQTGGTPVTLTGEDTASPTFTAPDTAGKLTFELTVTGPGGTASSAVTVTVTPDAPTADAGSAQTVASDGAVTLDGTGSTGTIDSYSWKQTAGPAVTLTGGNTASASFKAPVVSAPTTLTFELTVTGPGGSTTSSVNVDVAPAGAPAAKAGADRTVLTGSSVMLDGSASEGFIDSYQWKQTDGTPVTLSGADTAKPTFTAPEAAGTLTFELTVTGPGGTTTGTVTLTVADRAPAAKAGADQTTAGRAAVSLDGSGSTGVIASYAWSQTAGPAVALTGIDTARASFTAPDGPVDLIFQLTVTGPGGSSVSTVHVHVLPPPPVADAGVDHSANYGASAELNGTASKGAITSYQWKQIAGTPVVLTNGESALASFKVPAVTTAATLQFELTVQGPGGISRSTVSVTVQPPVKPTANAGVNQNVLEGMPVTLDGSASTGDELTYTWTQTGGTPVTLNGANTAKPTFTAPRTAGAEGLTLKFTLTVTGPGGTSTSSVSVIVKNFANAGPDQNVLQNTTVTLSGTASIEAASYSWRQVSGPSVTLNGANTANPTFTYPRSPDPVVFELTTRGPLGTDTDTVTITTSTDSINLISAQYDSSKGEWRIRGTSSVVGPGITIWLYVGDTLLDTTVVDALGDINYRQNKPNIPGSILTVKSSSGGSQTINITRR